MALLEVKSAIRSRELRKAASMTLTKDELFKMLSDAYARGAGWMLDNPDGFGFLSKAAYDYADKTTSQLSE